MDKERSLLSRLNNELVTSQIATYDKTGRWATRQVGRLRPPLKLANSDGTTYVIENGLVMGLILKQDGRYTDIRHGGIVALTTSKDEQRKVDQLVNTQTRDLTDMAWVVLWDEQGDPYIQIIPDVLFCEGDLV